MVNQFEFSFQPQPEMTDAEARIWNVIQNRKGRSRAIKSPDLEQITGLTVQEVCEAVNTLIDVHGKLIGSTFSRPYGYFVIETVEEFEATVKPLWSRVRRTSSRLRAMERNLKASGIHWQGKLELNAMGEMERVGVN